MNEPTRAELLRIVTLLEERHGVGVRGEALPRWLDERLANAVAALMKSWNLSASALLSRLEGDPDLGVELANALRVGETRFYRDPAQWEALRREVIPGLYARRTDGQSLVTLSAGCSTGQEAWTLAMLLAEATPRVGRAKARVLGVDRSEPALVTARAATYDVESRRQLPSELARRFLQPGLDGGLRVVPELQASVTFQARDLTRGPPPGRYAIVVCKNVLIYFSGEAQQRLARELVRCLSDDGVLIVARSEVPIMRALAPRSFEIAPGITAFGA